MSEEDLPKDNETGESDTPIKKILVANYSQVDELFRSMIEKELFDFVTYKSLDEVVQFEDDDIGVIITNKEEGIRLLREKKGVPIIMAGETELTPEEIADIGPDSLYRYFKTPVLDEAGLVSAIKSFVETGFKPPRISLIEPNDAYRRLLGAYLEAQGFEVDSFKKTKKQAQDKPADVLVTRGGTDLESKLGSINLDIDSPARLMDRLLDLLKENVNYETIRSRIDRAKKRVLVVDNDENYASRLRQNLDFLENVEIEVVDSVRKAMKKAEESDYDLVVSSLVLPKDRELGDDQPDGAGFEFLTGLKVPIITTSKFAFMKCSNSSAHIQKKYQNDIENIGKAIITCLYGRGKQPESAYEFQDYDMMDLPAFIRDLVKEDSMDSLENLTGLYSFEKRIEDEINYFAAGMGGRDKGYITKKTAIDIILRRRMVCREVAKKRGITNPKVNLERRMWEIYTDHEKKGAPISMSAALEKALTQPVPYIIVLIGPTCSGKTTIARALRDKLNEKSETYPAAYIGNLKTGEKRKGEMNGEDIYITEEEAKRLEAEGELGMYHHLDVVNFGERAKNKISRELSKSGVNEETVLRKYFSRDGKILKALKKDQNVILVRNMEGLKVVGNFLDKNPRLNVRLISFKLESPEGTLGERLKERLENQSISEQEYQIRKHLLSESINEYSQQRALWDYAVSTNRKAEDTLAEIIGLIDFVSTENPILHYEMNRYIRDKVTRLTKSAKARELEKFIEEKPMVLHVGKKHLKTAEAIKSRIKNSMLTLYLNPLYTPKEGESKEETEKEIVLRKRELIEYLKETFGEEPVQSNLDYGVNPSSAYSRAQVVYRNGTPATKVDDVALFSIIKDQSRPYLLTGDEIHSIAFVCLEEKKENITIKELS